MFKQKVLKVTLSLNEQSEQFVATDGSKASAVSHTGLRVSVMNNYGNGALYPTATITIYGLPMEKIDKIIRIRWNTKDSFHNYVKVEEGNIGEDLNFFYEGQITFARLDTTSAPDIALVIESQLAFSQKQKNAPSRSYLEGEKVQDIIEEICTDINFKYENNGVDITAPGEITLDNTNMEQIRSLCSAYQIDLAVEHDKIAITNPEEPREIPIPVITPKTGLLGYPTSTWQGISFSCLYNPLVKFHGPVTIKDSVVTMANRDWRIFGVRTQLEANMPNGAWSMEVNATWKLGDRIVR